MWTETNNTESWLYRTALRCNNIFTISLMYLFFLFCDLGGSTACTMGIGCWRFRIRFPIGPIREMAFSKLVHVCVFWVVLQSFVVLKIFRCSSSFRPGNWSGCLADYYYIIRPTAGHEFHLTRGFRLECFPPPLVGAISTKHVQMFVI